MPSVSWMLLPCNGYARSACLSAMDNKSIAQTLYETADLLEVRGDDPFRIRSYRRAAESIEGWPRPLIELAGDDKKMLEVPGIGKGMVANLKELFTQGKLALHTELLTQFRPS